MTFGQTWPDSGAGFGGPSLNDYDFSFDPALIDSLPDSIPDFWLVPPPRANTTDAPQQQQEHEIQHSHQQHQQHQHLETLTLNPAPLQQPSSSSNTLTPTTAAPPDLPNSRASSPSSDSPGGGGGSSSRAGAGRTSKRDVVEDPDVVVKRQRNTIAARKYRQKRLDRIQELEDALKAMTGERDDLRLRLARQEAETAALREMMQLKSGKGSE